MADPQANGHQPGNGSGRSQRIADDPRITLMARGAAIVGVPLAGALAGVATWLFTELWQDVRAVKHGLATVERLEDRVDDLRDDVKTIRNTLFGLIRPAAGGPEP